MSFQSGNDNLQRWEAFDHKVSPAYRWAIDSLADLLRSEGLIEVARLRVQPGPTAGFQTAIYLPAKPRQQCDRPLGQRR